MVKLGSVEMKIAGHIPAIFGYIIDGMVPI